MSDANNQSPANPPALENDPHTLTIHIRHRPLYEWLAWLVWLIVLGVLLEFCLTSLAEQETQAGVLAGALFLFLLLAGLIVEGMHQAERRSQYRHLIDQPDALPLFDELEPTTLTHSDDLHGGPDEQA